MTVLMASRLSAQWSRAEEANGQDQSTLNQQTTPLSLRANVTGSPISSSAISRHVIQPRRGLSPLRKLSPPHGQLSVVDSAVVYSTLDSTRHLYTYAGNGMMTVDLAQKWTNGVWVDSMRETRSYDASGNQTAYLSEQMVGSQWVGLTRFWMTYDANGQPTSNVFESCSSGPWVNHVRESWTYDAGGNLTCYTREKGVSSAWVGEYRFTYTYHPLKDTVLASHENWSDGQWVLGERDTFVCDANGRPIFQVGVPWWYGQGSRSHRVKDTYDTQGNLSSHMEGYRDTAQWVDYYRRTYTHDANGKLTSALSETRHDGPYWQSSMRETYTYNGQEKLISELYESAYNGGSWINENRVTYTYDNQENPTSELYEQWYDGQWKNVTLDSTTCLANGDLTSFRNYAWFNSSWIHADGVTSFSDNAGNQYSYNGYNVVLSFRNLVTEIAPRDENLPLTFSLAQNYPNPFNPTTRIRYNVGRVVVPSGASLSGVEGPVSGKVRLAIYNLLGREVATLVDEVKAPGSYEVRFDGSRLASGVYFYRMQSGDYVQSKKLLLLK
jgi:hypothetical protein